MDKAKRIPAKDFVIAWSEQPTLDAVATKLGAPLATLRSRASYLRRKGVTLRNFPSTRGGPRLNIDELNKIAAASFDGTSLPKTKAAKSSKAKAKKTVAKKKSSKKR